MQRMRVLLILHEGLFLKTYHCPAGKLTIGVGYNIDANGVPFGLTREEIIIKGITREQAMILMDNMIQECVVKLSANISWFHTLDGTRQMVLVDMAYNLGVLGLLKWRNTLTSVARKNYTRAAAEMIRSKWYKQVGTRSKRLVEMMRTGIFPLNMGK